MPIPFLIAGLVAVVELESQSCRAVREARDVAGSADRVDDVGCGIRCHGSAPPE